LSLPQHLIITPVYLTTCSVIATFTTAGKGVFQRNPQS